MLSPVREANIGSLSAIKALSLAPWMVDGRYHTLTVLLLMKMKYKNMGPENVLLPNSSFRIFGKWWNWNLIIYHKIGLKWTRGFENSSLVGDRVKYKAFSY